MFVAITTSPLKNKKYRATVYRVIEDIEVPDLAEPVTVDFGDSRYEDYTIHKDKERRDKYLLRHTTNEDWKNPLTAGFWSRWLLWNKPSLKKSAIDITNRFGITFI